MTISLRDRRKVLSYKAKLSAGTPRQQLARDIRNLRNYTNAPNSRLQQLIELNKLVFPELLKKP